MSHPTSCTAGFGKMRTIDVGTHDHLSQKKKARASGLLTHAQLAGLRMQRERPGWGDA